MHNINIIHSDLIDAIKLVYEPNGLTCYKLVQEKENQEYCAFEFEINNRKIKFRVAKLTPTKNGQFVTFYKRIKSSPIIPYDISDEFDFLIVSVRQNENLGQFVFPKSVLYEKNILSKENKGGKRAIRVYPQWDITVSKQAKRTQEWQLLYFFQILPDIDINKFKTLLI